MRARKRSLPSPHLKTSKIRKISYRETERLLRTIEKSHRLERSLKNSSISGRPNLEQVEAVAHRASAELGRVSRNYSRMERLATQATASRVLDHYRITNPKSRKMMHEASQELARAIFEDPTMDPRVPAGRIILIFAAELGDAKKADTAAAKLMTEIPKNCALAAKEISKIIKYD